MAVSTVLIQVRQYTVRMKNTSAPAWTRNGEKNRECQEYTSHSRLDNCARNILHTLGNRSKEDNRSLIKLGLACSKVLGNTQHGAHLASHIHRLPPANYSSTKDC